MPTEFEKSLKALSSAFCFIFGKKNKDLEFEKINAEIEDKLMRKEELEKRMDEVYSNLTLNQRFELRRKRSEIA